MKSIVAFFRELGWYVNGLYTGISFTLLLVYILAHQSEKNKKKRKKIRTQ